MVSLEEVNVDHITISPILTRTEYNSDKRETYNFVKLYYENRDFCLRIGNASSFYGVQVSKLFKAMFLSVQLTDKQVKLVHKIEDRIHFLIFQVRMEFLETYANLTRIRSPSDVGFLMREIVQNGQLDNLTHDRFPDQITMVVPSAASVNAQECKMTISQVTNLKYSADVDVELAEVEFCTNFAGHIQVRAIARKIDLEAKLVAKYNRPDLYELPDELYWEARDYQLPQTKKRKNSEVKIDKTDIVFLDRDNTEHCAHSLFLSHRCGEVFQLDLASDKLVIKLEYAPQTIACFLAWVYYPEQSIQLEHDYWCEFLEMSVKFNGPVDSCIDYMNRNVSQYTSEFLGQLCSKIKSQELSNIWLQKLRTELKAWTPDTSAEDWKVGDFCEVASSSLGRFAAQIVKIPQLDFYELFYLGSNKNMQKNLVGITKPFLFRRGYLVASMHGPQCVELHTSSCAKVRPVFLKCTCEYLITQAEQ
jgi:hypothetical protein